MIQEIENNEELTKVEKTENNIEPMSEHVDENFVPSNVHTDESEDDKKDSISDLATAYLQEVYDWRKK